MDDLFAPKHLLVVALVVLVVITVVRRRRTQRRESDDYPPPTDGATNGWRLRLRIEFVGQSPTSAPCDEILSGRLRGYHPDAATAPFWWTVLGVQMTLDDPHYYDCPSCEWSGWRSRVRAICRDGFGRMLYKCGDCDAHVTESALRTAYRWRLIHSRTDQAQACPP